MMRYDNVNMALNPYKLREWVNLADIDWNTLSGNEHPMAMEMLEQNIDKIDWKMLSSNRNALHLLEKNIDKIDWKELSYNRNALHLLEQHIDKIDWKFFTMYNKNAKIILQKDEYANHPRYLHYLCRFAKYDEICILEQHLEDIDEQREWVQSVNERRMHSVPPKPPMFVPIDNLNWSTLSWNTHAMDILEKHPDKIDWKYLSYNSHPRAIQLLQENLDKIDWYELCSNSSPLVGQILEQHYEKISWDSLSSNSNPWAIDFLEQHMDKINWFMVAENTHPRAMELLERNIPNIPYFDIYYSSLSENIEIFTYNTEYNYDEMKENKRNLHEDLIQTMFHPRNIAKFESWGFETGFL